MFTLQACNLSPVYSKKDNGVSPVATELASIAVSKIGDDRNGQILRTRLEDMLDPKSNTSAKNYDLIVDVSVISNPLAIEQDAEITRYNMVYGAKVRLKNRETGKVVFKENSNITGSYQTDSSDFATYTVENDTLKRLVEESAQDIRARLINYFVNKR
jgi:LPS-assembly lipoprotein